MYCLQVVLDGVINKVVEQDLQSREGILAELAALRQMNTASIASINHILGHSSTGQIGAVNAQRGEPYDEDGELRFDPVDGELYFRSEFVQAYGGSTREWHKAIRYRRVDPRVISSALVLQCSFCLVGFESNCFQTLNIF